MLDPDIRKLLDTVFVSPPDATAPDVQALARIRGERAGAAWRRSRERRRRSRCHRRGHARPPRAAATLRSVAWRSEAAGAFRARRRLGDRLARLARPPVPHAREPARCRRRCRRLRMRTRASLSRGAGRLGRRVALVQGRSARAACRLEPHGRGRRQRRRQPRSGACHPPARATRGATGAAAAALSRARCARVVRLVRRVRDRPQPFRGHDALVLEGLCAERRSGRSGACRRLPRAIIPRSLRRSSRGSTPTCCATTASPTPASSRRPAWRHARSNVRGWSTASCAGAAPYPPREPASTRSARRRSRCCTARPAAA